MSIDLLPEASDNVRMHVRLAGVLVGVITLSSLAPVASAGNPRENYNRFVSTDRVNEEYDAQCREELGIAEGELPVATKLYQLRRCINKLGRQSDRDREIESLRNREALRRARGTERYKTILEKQAQTVQRGIQRNLRTRRQFRQKPSTESVREKLRSQRAQRRVEQRQREEESSQAHVQRREFMRSVREACSLESGEERRECIRQQIHNLNLR